MRYPPAWCWSSPKLADPHPVDPPLDDDLYMLAIADLAAEDRCPALPQHRHAGAPNRGEIGAPENATLRLLRWLTLRGSPPGNRDLPAYAGSVGSA